MMSRKYTSYLNQLQEKEFFFPQDIESTTEFHHQ